MVNTMADQEGIKQIIKLYLVTTMTSPSQYIGKEVRERAIHTQT